MIIYLSFFYALKIEMKETKGKYNKQIVNNNFIMKLKYIKI